jgi:hypothetical protein
VAAGLPFSKVRNAGGSLKKEDTSADFPLIQKIPVAEQGTGVV